jgi:uncharacterized protein
VVQGLSRDRDLTGRPRNARPRDELGRPLPRDDAGSHAPVAEPDPPALPPDEALAQAQRLLDADSPFTAHEVLEAVWKNTPEQAERGLWRGLAQLAVGLTHHARGNATGAAALLRRAVETLAPYAGTHPHQVAVDDLRTWATHAAARGDVTGMPPLRG